jgi:small subunit ribosomal protein S1
MNQFPPENRLYSTPENQRLISTEAGLAAALQEHILLEGMVLRCDVSHDLWVSLAGRCVKIPRAQGAWGIEEGLTRDIALMTRVGRPICFYVEGMEGSGDTLRLRLSRRAAQQEALDFLMSLPLGTVLSATVTHLEPFGAFVDVGCGVPSLLPIEQISISRIPHPSARFQVGQEILVLLTGKEPESGRIFLSHRELLGTWTENAAEFQVGDTVPGIVRSIQDYGTFVELTPNLSGLTEQTHDLTPGDRVAVCIKSLVPQRRKIKLSVVGRLEPSATLPPLRYFVREGVLRRWDYGPADCARPDSAHWEAVSPDL